MSVAMEKKFVTVKGEKFYAVERLDLSNKGITDISEIEGLEKFTQLRRLDLRNNLIEEVKGLEVLTELVYLNLRGNRLKNVKGLEKLKKLRDLHLENNQITEIDRNIGGFIHIRGNPINKEEPDPNNEYVYSGSCIVCGYTGKLSPGELLPEILRWESRETLFGTDRDRCGNCGAEYIYKGESLVLDSGSIRLLQESETLQEKHIFIPDKLKAEVKEKFLKTPRSTAFIELGLKDIEMVEQFDEFGIAIGYAIYSKLGVTYTTAWRDLRLEWKKLKRDLENASNTSNRKTLEIFYTYKDLFNQRYIEVTQTLSKEVLEHLAHEIQKLGVDGRSIGYYEQWKDTRYVLKDNFNQRSAKR